MPRGVYKRKPRKMRKPKNPLAKGYTRIYLDVPERTYERLKMFESKSNMPWSSHVLKAIYNMLPVEYEVDSQFVFPFGKYEGERAGQVKGMDPSYLDRATRTITGFKLAGDFAPTSVFASFSDKFDKAKKQYGGQLRRGERIRINSLGKVWAYNSYISPANRFLGYLKQDD